MRWVGRRRWRRRGRQLLLLRREGRVLGARLRILGGVSRNLLTRGPFPHLSLMYVIWLTESAAHGSIHIAIKENLSVSLLREGGLKSMELRGDMLLTITDPSLSRIRVVLSDAETDLAGDLQLKQHPHVNKFPASGKKVIGLKNEGKGFPVGQQLSVLKWRYGGKDESYVPLSRESLSISPNLNYAEAK